ncbi:MAG: glycosyltransferase family 4 protein [Proteobacteria bacterium]|nr:glycosyltransferase family 4 protein [Pseudomonadota bacterium]
MNSLNAHVNNTAPNSVDSGPERIIIVTTMFDHGGVISYWKDLIKFYGVAEWTVFTNKAESVAQDPFQDPQVRVHVGLVWNSVSKSSSNLIAIASSSRPNAIIFNGTLAIFRLLPAILYIRLMQPKIRLKCVFHNAAIYKAEWKNILNNLVVSFCGLFMHANVFVSKFVQSYWLCRGEVLSRPFQATCRDSSSLYGNRRIDLLPTIGFLGRLSPEKDPELYLQAMNLLRSSLNCHVTVAGLGPLKPKLAEEYPWASFVGWVNSEEWLKSVDLMITSSKTEGWPYSLGEALESGVPVLGMSVGGVEEVLGPQRAKWLSTDRAPQTMPC